MAKGTGLFIVMLSMAVASCITNRPQHDTGEIIVSTPKIHTRESLVQDRKRELEWLEDQLLTVPVQGVQGIRFTRDFSLTSASAQIQADPTVIKKYRESQKLDTNNIKREDALAAATHERAHDLLEQQQEIDKRKTDLNLTLTEGITQNELDRRQVVLDVVREQLDATKKVCGENLDETETVQNCQTAQTNLTNLVEGVFGDGMSINDLSTLLGHNLDFTGSTGGPVGEPRTFSQPKTEVGKKAAVTEADLATPERKQLTDDLNALKAQIDGLQNALSEGAKAPPKPEDLGTDQPRSTPIQAFEEKLSYRQRVRDEISQTRLDDRHDTVGRTLYKMQFDVSILPRRNVESWARVKVTITPRDNVFFPQEFAKLAYKLSNIESRANADVAHQINDGIRCFAEKNLNSDGQSNDTGDCDDGRTNSARKLTKREWNEIYELAMDSYVKVRDQLGRKQSLVSDSWLKVVSSSLAWHYEQIERKIGNLLKKKNEGGLSRLSSEEKSIFESFEQYIYDSCPVFEQAEYCLRLDCRECKDDLYDFSKEIDDVWTLLEAADIRTAQLRKLFAVDLARETYNRDYDIANILSVRPNFGRDVLPIDVDFATADNESVPGTLGKLRFWSRLIRSATMDAYSVTPKESVQKIADIAEVQRLLNIDIGANFLAGSVGGQAFLQYVKGKEKLFNTILRTPVVMALPGQVKPAKCELAARLEDCELSSVTFGWIIGPVYKITNERDDAVFFQVPTNKTVSALASLPEWWTSINVETDVSWLAADDLSEIPATNEAIEPQVVELPGRYPELEQLFAASPRRDPYAYEETRDYVVKGNTPASIVIEGIDLWRTSVVTLGNLRSDRVEVLPNMKGIVAEFDYVTKSACGAVEENEGQAVTQAETENPNDESCDAELVVWTSMGRTSPGTVRVEFPGGYTPDLRPTVFGLSRLTATMGETVNLQIHGANFSLDTDDEPKVRIGGMEVDPSKITVLSRRKIAAASFSLGDSAWSCPKKVSEAREGEECSVEVTVQQQSGVSKPVAMVLVKGAPPSDAPQ